MRRGRWGTIVCEHDESERMADNRCRACTRAKQREWYHRNLDYARKKARERQTSGRLRNSHLRRKYGITLETEQAMLAGQDGRCAACDQEFTDRNHHCVDHDHQTGLVRALLCSRCNRALGAIDDDPDVLEKLREYVLHHRAVVTDR